MLHMQDIHTYTHTYIQNNELLARQVQSFGLTEGNMKDFLGIMEERILQIIQVTLLADNTTTTTNID